MRSCGLVWKRRGMRKLEIVGGLNDGSSDDESMEGSSSITALQLQAFPTATIDGIIRMKNTS